MTLSFTTNASSGSVPSADDDPICTPREAERILRIKHQIFSDLEVSQYQVALLEGWISCLLSAQ
jgi:hypothetical protein